MLVDKLAEQLKDTTIAREKLKMESCERLGLEYQDPGQTILQSHVEYLKTLGPEQQ